MKKVLFSFICVLSSIFAFSQISINKSDLFEANDSIPQIYYAFENNNDYIVAEEVIPENLVFGSQSAFSLIMIDTLVYYPPSEFDTSGDFEEANCTFKTKDGYIMHLKITEEKVELVGMQAELPFTSDMMNLKFDKNIVMYNFPCEFEDQNIDQGVAMEDRHISEFQNIIPAEYYSYVTMLYDSVRFYSEIKLNSSFDEFGTIKFIGDSIQNGEFEYLRENLKMTTLMDVKLRNKISGTYTSLSNAPGIGDQLPMELPILDTNYVHNYWTKNNKQQILEIKYTTDYSGVHSMTFKYAYLSFVNTDIIANLSVYPNPVSDIINFSIENCKNYNLHIFSTDGRLVNTFPLQSDETEIDISTYRSGVYYYQIFDNKLKAIAGGKFIKK